MQRDSILHHSSDHRTLRLTERRHFVAYLKVSSDVTIEYNIAWITGFASCLQFLFLPLAKPTQHCTSPDLHTITGQVDCVVARKDSKCEVS